MTRIQILHESPAWLRILLEAANKRRAQGTLLMGQTMLAAMAATQTKGGQSVWKKVSSELEKMT